MGKSKSYLLGGRAISVAVAAVFLISLLALMSRAAGPVSSRIADEDSSNDGMRGDVAAMTPSRARAAYGSLPLSFEANGGQTNGAVNFLSRGRGYTLFLTPSEAVFVLGGAAAAPESPAVLRMKLEGADAQAASSGEEKLEGKVNYFIGNDPRNWRTNIPTFARVRYAGVYEGVDLIYYGNQQQLEYDFIVRPGGDHSRILLGFNEGVRVEVESSTGDLLLRLGEKTLRQRKPVVYQEVDGHRQEIASGYELKGANRVGFAVGSYDARKPLVIDPVLIYSTYLGGSSAESANAITVDSSGQAYFAAGVNSPNFPLTSGAFDTTFVGGQETVVAKINAAGSALLYSTYLGGIATEVGSGIAVDPAGNACVAGRTNSSDFPTTPGSFDTTFGGGTCGAIPCNDAYVVKLNPTGSALVYSTYLGGAADDRARAIALDGSGNTYITGLTASPDFPMANAFDNTFGAGPNDGFVTILNAGGTALIASTYLGGSGDDQAQGIGLDSSGNIYVAGFTASANFPTDSAFDSSYNGGAYDAFVTKLSANAGTVGYSTYVGGTGDDRANAMTVDSSGNVSLTGLTGSSDFPILSAIDSTFGGGASDVFVTQIKAPIPILAYSTYLGGAGLDTGLGITVDLAGNIYVTGSTTSADFPTKGAIQAIYGGNTDAFVSELGPEGSNLIFSTFLGGNAFDAGLSLAADAAGNIYAGGHTASPNFPTVSPIQGTKAGTTDTDTFIVKLGLPTVLGNISTRLRVGTGDNALIAGFIVTGTQPKRVMLRGIGPSLSAFPDRLANPIMELRNSSGSLLDSNDDWVNSPNRQAIIDSTIPPSNDLESAIIATLPANGAGYTAIVRGVNDETGTGIVEAYDLDRFVDSKLANISTRGLVETGDNVLIAGTIVLGQLPQKIIVRAIGPSLTVSGKMDDPILELRDANGALVRANDNWRTGGQEAEIMATTIPPPNDLESAIVETLSGNGASYTAIVRGVNNTTGIALVEVYALN